MRLSRGDLYALLSQMERQPCGHEAEHQRVELWSTYGEGVMPPEIACEACEAQRQAEITASMKAVGDPIQGWARHAVEASLRTAYVSPFKRLP